MKRLIIVGAAFAANAEAHVVMAPADAAPGTYYAGEFRIGHGCEEAATTAVRVELPENIIIARARPKPGWTIEVERTRLPSPVMSEGREQPDRVAAITWHGNLPADQFDGFGLMIKLQKGQSGPLYLPVRQTCGGQSINWSQIPDKMESWGSLQHPAPFIMVKSGIEGHGH